MAKKQDSFYFDSFSICIDYACQAAHLLYEVMADYRPEAIKERLDEMHVIEHSADAKKHELLNVLAKAFITPIEREDIMLLSQNIDEVTDQIEDVLLRLYCFNIQSIRPEALQLAEVIIQVCEETKLMAKEFADFKHSKTLHTHIVNINTMEEQADELFISNLRTLHTTCADPLAVLTWQEIYTFMERCVDTCEHVADSVESVVMKNS